MNYITTKEAAEQLKISIRRVNKLLEDGRITAQKFAGVWMIRQEDVDAFAQLPRPVGWPKGRPRKKTLETD